MENTVENTLTLDKVSTFEELSRLTSAIGIPEFQRTRAAWLVKNLPKRHSQHPSYPMALQLAKLILVKGWS